MFKNTGKCKRNSGARFPSSSHLTTTSLIRAEGLEPPTPWLQTRHSTKLSYTLKMEHLMTGALIPTSGPLWDSNPSSGHTRCASHYTIRLQLRIYVWPSRIQTFPPAIRRCAVITLSGHINNIDIPMHSQGITGFHMNRSIKRSSDLPR